MLAALPLLALPPLAHVPQYACEHGCCHAAHEHSTSQVAYLKNSGGLELDVADLHTDADGEGETIDFDFVFKEPYDTSTFSLYVGCGGCASRRPKHWDPTLTLPIDLPVHYQQAKFESFTQHAYYPLLAPGLRRQFDTRQLWNCSSPHFSLRLVKYDNATEDIVWGAVLGCEDLSCEKFTLLETILFPWYVARNHGAVWNGAAWTLPVYAVAMALLLAFVLWWWWGGWLALSVPHSVTFPRQLALMRLGTAAHWANLPCVVWEQSPRCTLYAIGVWAALVDLAETSHHAGIASAHVHVSDNGYVIFVFWMLFKLFFLLAAALPWAWAREVPEGKWRAYKFACTCGDWYDGLGFGSPFWACGQWCLFDLAIALAALFWFGVGFFVYPLVMGLAALLRAWEWLVPSPLPLAPGKCELYVSPEAQEEADTSVGIPLPTLNLSTSGGS